jgi:gamma-glutamylcyclotransferase (GGCT)/AIG2-like uncharacterized protein YtfP
MSKLLSSEADFLGEASCRGKLYMVAHYPGLLYSDDANDIVFGELFRLRKPDELMAALDDYESVGPDHPQPTLYLRERIAVTLADGSTSEAWTYIYNKPVDETKRIKSGRFLAP